MANRYEDWMKQAQRDINHAKHALEDGDYEWSCFSAQQAAEKAVKSLFLKLHSEVWGHSISLMLSKLPEEYKPNSEVIDKAKNLDKNYIVTRYPNGFDLGIPGDYYTLKEATDAINIAEEIIGFCRSKICQ